MEHLPEKVIEDLSDISRWLVANGNSTELLKDYITLRSSMLIKSLTGYELSPLIMHSNTLMCLFSYTSLYI